MRDLWPSLIAVAVLISVHTVASRLVRRPTSRARAWLSAAAGTSLAYVFVHLIPDLARLQHRWRELIGPRRAPWLEEQIYLMAMLGVIAAHASSVWVERHERPLLGFWVDLGFFAVYDVLIGYLVAQPTTLPVLALGTLALGVHFLVNASALARAHPDRYHRVGRRVLSAAVLLGWAIGRATEASVLVEAIVTAFLSGGILFNVLHEELPTERESQLGPFVAGAAAYAALVLLALFTLRAGP